MNIPFRNQATAVVMFPNIPITYRDKERESSKLDNLYIDRKNTLHASSSLSSTPHSRDVQARFMTEINHIPNDDIFGQLEVSRKYFSEIIANTSTHRDSLESIKRAYENVLFSEENKLSNQRPESSPLAQSVTTTREELEKAHLRLGKKEAELYKQHYDNIKLQTELNEQILKISILETENRTKSKELFPSTLSLSFQTDLTKLPQKEQIEKLHVIYDEQEEFLSDIKDDLKRNYVASTECKHVEMCINDVEVIVQKEKRVKESLDENLDELTQQIYTQLLEVPFSSQESKSIIQSILLSNSIPQKE